MADKDAGSHEAAPSYVKCPFCGEDDFDLIGLKGHLKMDCEVFDKTEVRHRPFWGLR